MIKHLCRIYAVALAICVCLIFPVENASAVVLYDGSVGNLPSDQGFVYQNLPGGIVPTAAGGATNLDSTPFGNANLAGYFRFSPLPLDSATGYTLRFSVEILSESHANAERAGFSVIAVGNNVAAGVPSSIEIGFQENRVFSQNDAPLFGNPAADESNFNPIGVGFVDYDLVVAGTGYQLFADTVQILNGSLRDYTAFAGPLDPYEAPDFIFFGDDTSSAQANVNFRSAEVIPVPEPSVALGLLALAVFGVLGAVVSRK